MRVLAIDLGERRVGFAVSDDEGIIASPLRIAQVRSLPDACEVVLAAVEETGAGKVVLGHPRNMDGRAGPKAKEAEEFAAMLREDGLIVELWDERLTTAEAERSMKDANLSRKQRKKSLDAVAAQRILQSWLQAQRNS